MGDSNHDERGMTPEYKQTIWGPDTAEIIRVILDTAEQSLHHPVQSHYVLFFAVPAVDWFPCLAEYEHVFLVRVPFRRVFL